MIALHRSEIAGIPTVKAGKLAIPTMKRHFQDFAGRAGRVCCPHQLLLLLSLARKQYSKYNAIHYAI